MGLFGSLFGSGAPSASPPPAAGASTPGYKPSALDIGLQMLLGQETPADAADHLRQLRYQDAMRPVQQQALQKWLSAFGDGAPAQPGPAPTQPADDGPKSLDEAFGMGLGRAIGASPQAAPAQQPQAQPQTNPFDLADPRTQRMLAGGAMFGMPGSKEVLDIAKAAAPNYVNGVRVNSPNRRAPDFVPTFDKGQEPLYNSRGEIVGVRNMDGSVKAAADMAGAVTGAQEGAKAGWDLIPVPQSDGSTVMMPRAQAVGALGGGAPRGPSPGAVAGRPGGGARLGVSQTPADAAAAKVEAEAGANSRVNAPNQLASAQQAISLIDQLSADPGLKDRTGLKGVLPAIPGTHGVAIDAMHKQLTGKVFLQAYGELKGAGAITEIEGQKAQDAIARLNRAQSYGDYVSALRDLRTVVAGGMGRVDQRSSLGRGQSGAGNFQPAPAAGQRQANAIYNTPRGPMKWTGTGWLPAN